MLHKPFRMQEEIYRREIVLSVANFNATQHVSDYKSTIPLDDNAADSFSSINTGVERDLNTGVVLNAQKNVAQNQNLLLIK